MSQLSSATTLEHSTDAHAVLGGRGMLLSLPPNLDWKLLKDACHSARRCRAHILTYFDDLDHDLTIVEYKAGLNSTNIQETMEHVIIIERKILRINMVINKYLPCQEGRPLGRNTAMTKGHLVETVSLGLMLVISLIFVAMAIHDFGK